jgi:hypothetical protein
MASFLSETLGVAESGVAWDVGNFKLFQSTRPDVALYITKQPELIRNPPPPAGDGRYSIAVSSYTQQQPDGSIKITGGSAIFGITSAIQFDPKSLQAAQDSWRAAAPPTTVPGIRFVPLNVQKGVATVLIDPLTGKPDEAHNDKDVGTPGGTLSFLVELNELGAQQWVQGIKNRTAIPAGVKFMYEYLRMMPPVGAEVIVHGKRVFQHLSTALDVSVDGFWYAGSAKINTAWEDMVRNGAVEVTFLGGGLPPDLEKLRQDLTTSFAAQARELLFNQIFAPKPNVQPAQAGNTSGVFGGANFALNWRKESDAIDLNQTIKFEGMTWLKASMDTNLATLFANLDQSYVTEVQTQQSFPTSLVIDGDPLLSDVALSLNFSEGHIPEAPVFAQDGGTQRFVVTSQHPNQVNINYDAKVNYAAARWPIIPVKGSATVQQGGNQIVIKPAAWVGRHQIFMFVRDGDKIVPPDTLTLDDYLILNVSYSGPHLPTPVRDSAHLNGLEMVEFSYPLDPMGRPGQAKFSAFGVIGGKLVRATEQIIDPNETAVFVLATRGGNIQLVSQNSVLPEDDALASRLLGAAARPVLSGGPMVEAGRNGYGQPGSTDKNTISGMLLAVEYADDGSALWVDDGGVRKRVRMLDRRVVHQFLDEQRRPVKVHLDASGQGDRVLVELPA